MESNTGIIWDTKEESRGIVLNSETTNTYNSKPSKGDFLKVALRF